MGSVLLIFLVFCVVLSYVYVLSSVLWCSLWFPHTNYMFGSSLHPVVCGRVHVLFTFIIYLLSIYAVKWLVVDVGCLKSRDKYFSIQKTVRKVKKKEHKEIQSIVHSDRYLTSRKGQNNSELSICDNYIQRFTYRIVHFPLLMVKRDFSWLRINQVPATPRTLF